MSHQHREVNRLEQTFKEFMESHKQKFEEIDRINKEIENEINNIKPDVFKFLRRNCEDQMKWLEEHGTIYMNEKGINIHLNSNPDGISADAKLSELDVCANNNDLGLNSFFIESNSRKNLILKENQSCVNKCTFRSEDKTEKELRHCIQHCFKDSFMHTDELLKDIKNKIDYVKKNLYI